MLDINEIVQSAHGGAALGNIADQFGISTDQAQSAVNALIPALSRGLQNQARNPDGLGEIVATVAADGPHQQAYADPDAAFAPDAMRQGSDLLNKAFGSADGVDKVVAHAAQVSGVSPSILQQLLPSLVSMILGGLCRGMQNQGLGGVLGQLAGSATSGGLGSIFGQLASGQGGGGLLGGLLGSLLGNGSRATVPGASPAPAAPNENVQAGLNSLTHMFRPGIKVPDDQEQALDSVIGQILGSKR